MATDIQNLIEQYKVQFQKTSQTIVDAYQNAPQHIESMKQKVTNFQPTVQGWIDGIQNTIKNQIADVAPIGTDIAIHKQILEIYTLVAVGLFASSIGHVIGSTFLGWLVSMFVSTNYSFILALIVLPLATMYYVRKNDMPKEDRNIAIIASAFFTAMLLGSNLSERYLSISPPPMFVIPLVMGSCSVFLGPSLGKEPRTMLLGASVGAAVGMYFVVGLVSGNLGGSYMTWMILLGGAAVFDYQMKLAQFYEGSYGLGSHAIISITTFIAVGFLLTAFVFSSSSPPDE